jgi:hypothetical protein
VQGVSTPVVLVEHVAQLPEASQIPFRPPVVVHAEPLMQPGAPSDASGPASPPSPELDPVEPDEAPDPPLLLVTPLLAPAAPSSDESKPLSWVWFDTARHAAYRNSRSVVGEASRRTRPDVTRLACPTSCAGAYPVSCY